LAGLEPIAYAVVRIFSFALEMRRPHLHRSMRPKELRRLRCVKSEPTNPRALIKGLNKAPDYRKERLEREGVGGILTPTKDGGFAM